MKCKLVLIMIVISYYSGAFAESNSDSLFVGPLGPYDDAGGTYCSIKLEMFSYKTIRFQLLDNYLLGTPHFSIISDCITTSVFIKPHEIHVSINPILMFFPFLVNDNELAFWLAAPQYLTNWRAQLSFFKERLSFQVGINTDYYLFNKHPKVYSEAMGSVGVAVVYLKKLYIKFDGGIAQPIFKGYLDTNQYFCFIRLSVCSSPFVHY